MKRIGAILFTYFYLLGTFLLPMGNFSVLVNLPEMYRHCKTFEDKDMTPLDFITDHLVCLDSLIDSHNKGDDQKPHQPLPKSISTFQQPVFLYFTFSMVKSNLEDTHITYGYLEMKHPQKFYKSIFHPPIV